MKVRGKGKLEPDAVVEAVGATVLAGDCRTAARPTPSSPGGVAEAFALVQVYP
jgi:hypothetical protein